MKRHGIMLYAKNVAAMTAFYRDVLQLQLVTETDDWVEFDAGGFLVALHAIPAGIAANIEIATPPRPRSGTPIKLLLQVSDFGAVRQRLRAIDCELTSPRVDAADQDRIDGIDPEGNIFTVSSRT